VLGIKSRTSYMLGKCPTTDLCPSPVLPAYSVLFCCVLFYSSLLFLFFPLWCWGLNSGPCTCQAKTVPLQQSQPLL
jgi:hypothetical protein